MDNIPTGNHALDAIDSAIATIVNEVRDKTAPSAYNVTKGARIDLAGARELLPIVGQLAVQRLAVQASVPVSVLLTLPSQIELPDQLRSVLQEANQAVEEATDAIVSQRREAREDADAAARTARAGGTQIPAVGPEADRAAERDRGEARGEPAGRSANPAVPGVPVPREAR